ncbi:MAG: ABC transporter substrate-binding protein, partial [Candidatus Krumholzibacteriia bacterium]
MGGRLATILALAAALPALWAGGGCGRGGAPAPGAGGTAVIALAAEPDLLNPLLTGSAYATQLLGLMEDGLVEMGEDLEFHPRIADSWTFAPDSLSVTFHLRPWVWSDGAPLTARDVATSFALLTDPVVGG